MRILQFFNYFFIKDLYQIFLIFIVGGLALYVGYFFEYSTVNVLFFIFILLFLFFLIFFILNRKPLFFSVYTWFSLYLLFPKKTIVYALNSVLTHMVNLPDNISILTEFSFYDIINMMVVIVICYKIFNSKKPFFNQNIKQLFIIFFMPFLAGLFTTIYYNFFLINQFGSNYLNQFHHLLQMFEGLILSVAIFKCVKTKSQITLFFNLAIAITFITIVEFLLAKYTSILPSIIEYFVFDYRGGFRSIIHSSPLITGMIIFYGFLGALYKRGFYFIIPFLAIIPIFYTYQRSTMLLFIISSLFFFYNFIVSKYFIKRLIQFMILILLFVPSYKLISNNVGNFIEETNVDEVSGTVIKEDGWFIFSSSEQRSAVRKRGLDVFYHFPLSGSGPGNIKLMMSNNSIPQKANTLEMGTRETQQYYDVVSGFHPTDPHNFYVRIIGEYGIFGIIFLTALAYLLFSKIIRINIVNNEKIIAISGIISISLYALLQTFPISFPLLIFLFRIIDIDDV